MSELFVMHTELRNDAAARIGRLKEEHLTGRMYDIKQMLYKIKEPFNPKDYPLEVCRATYGVPVFNIWEDIPNINENPRYDWRRIYMGKTVPCYIFRSSKLRKHALIMDEPLEHYRELAKNKYAELAFLLQSASFRFATPVEIIKHRAIVGE